MAKVNKTDINRKVDDLPIRAIISNIGTLTYHLAKPLVQLLKLSSEFQYTMKNDEKFTKKIRKEKIPKDHIIVSFDVVPLFTNVRL